MPAQVPSLWASRAVRPAARRGHRASHAEPRGQPNRFTVMFRSVVPHGPSSQEQARLGSSEASRTAGPLTGREAQLRRRNARLAAAPLAVIPPTRFAGDLMGSAEAARSSVKTPDQEPDRSVGRAWTQRPLEFWPHGR